MRKLLRLLSVSAIAVALPSCDLVKSATSTIIVSGLLVSSPEIQYQGLFDLKAETIATAWVGERESGTSSEEPDPISGADVSVTEGSKITLSEQQDGIYLKSSVEDATLAYTPGATYVFDALVQGDAEVYGGQGVAPPKLENDDLTFNPALGAHPMIAQLKTHTANTDLTVTWPQDSGRYAYVTVLRADRANPDQPQQVFDTKPETAKEILDFVLGDPPTSVTIPAATFDRDGLYAVLLVAANKGGPRSNTFFGSPYLIGSGAVSLFAIGDIGP